MSLRFEVWRTMPVVIGKGGGGGGGGEPPPPPPPPLPPFGATPGYRLVGVRAKGLGLAKDVD